MKRFRTLFLILVVAIVGVVFAGCSSKATRFEMPAQDKKTTISVSEDIDSQFVLIGIYSNGFEADSDEICSYFDAYYYYDVKTNIVYLASFSNSYGSGLCPYISAEGTYVKYVDGEFVNVE